MINLAHKHTLVVVFCSLKDPNETRDFFRVVDGIGSAQTHLTEIQADARVDTIAVRAKDISDDLRAIGPIAQTAALNRDYSGWVTLKQAAKLTFEERLDKYIKENFDSPLVYTNDSVRRVIVSSGEMLYKVYETKGELTHKTYTPAVKS